MSTHQVFFTNGTQTIGPVDVDTTDEDDMLVAAAIAQDSVKNWQVKVRRNIDGWEQKFEASEANEWWA